MIQEKQKNINYFETIQDWVVYKYCDVDKNPNHCQFSAAEVAQIIMDYQGEKLSGKIKFK